MVYESSLDDFCKISYYVLGIKSFVRLYLMEKNAFLVSAYIYTATLHVSCCINVKTWEFPTCILKSCLLRNPRRATISGT